jgi:hypothetical protein
MSNEGTAERLGLARRLVRWLAGRYYPNVKITGGDRLKEVVVHLDEPEWEP